MTKTGFCCFSLVCFIIFNGCNGNNKATVTCQNSDTLRNLYIFKTCCDVNFKLSSLSIYLKIILLIIIEVYKVSENRGNCFVTLIT